MGAIHSDELGRAEIDYSKCVSCGQCLVNCPFGAIADKGQIYQLIQGFNRGDRIYALVAPAFINQFPGLASTGKLKAALKALASAMSWRSPSVPTCVPWMRLTTSWRRSPTS